MAISRQNLIELVQQNHPQMGESEILFRANTAIAEFSSKTGISRVMTDIGDTVAGQRYYPSEASVPLITLNKIYNVYLNDVRISRIVAKDAAMLIDDDEHVNSDNAVPTGVESSTERYWYPLRKTVTVANVDYNIVQLGLVEKLSRAITRNETTSEFQSVSVSGLQIRVEADTLGDYLVEDSNENAGGGRTSFPAQFTNAIPYKVIAEGYKSGTNQNIQLAQYFDFEYEKLVKEAKKFVRSNYVSTGHLVPHPY